MRGPLTGITNRIAHGERPASECAPWKRHRYPLAPMIRDVDHFKLVDDNCGHKAGERPRSGWPGLAPTLCVPDFLACYGGEEFVALLHKHSASKSLLRPRNSAEKSNRVIFIIDRNESQSGFTVDMQLSREEAPDELPGVPTLPYYFHRLMAGSDAAVETLRDDRSRIGNLLICYLSHAQINAREERIDGGPIMVASTARSAMVS